jgi:TRAP-type mannitol/chloroaromatic compound transport system permease small subunit
VAIRSTGEQRSQHPIIQAIDRLNEWIGHAVAWLTLVMVAVTFGVVVLRYGFDIGSIAVQESVTYFHAMVFLLGAAYTLRRDEHVRVDIFYQRLSERRKALVDVAGTLLFLIPVCVFIFWISLEYVVNAWSIREGSREAGGLPAVYLLKSLIPLTAALLTLQGLAFGARRLQDWRQAD